MKHTFNLRDSQGHSSRRGTAKKKTNNLTLIYFQTYFNEEKKKVIYSTGENILPSEWDFKNNMAKTRGVDRAKNYSSINMQLRRYSDLFENLEVRCKRINQTFTSDLLREALDNEFKKVKASPKTFFDFYDEFTREKITKKEWKPSTIKRYKNIKNLLLEFEKYKRTKLSFNSINDKFYTEFTEFCYTERKHFTNTFARNMGLVSSFLIWSLEKQYHYNESFKKFKKPKKSITQEIALSLFQVQEIANFKFESMALKRVRDVFVFQCLTGLRYGEMKSLSRRNIINGKIILKEDKDLNKEVRIIPLAPIAETIIKQYDYKLPLLSNQKQNETIKKVIAKVGLNHDVQFTKIRGVEKTVVNTTFDQRISTHTARRTFITIMKSKKIPDKVIMEMSGHKDIKTFNSYYRVDEEKKKDAINEVFGNL